MPTFSLSLVLQLVVGLGLLNVWLLRAKSSTSYRGGSAQSLKEEFQTYGLPEGVFYVVGGQKILAGVALLAGVWMPSLIMPAAAVVGLLMVGAIAMHVKVQDPPMKSLPAALMLLFSVALIYLNS